ncbi:hypothetical protein [Azospirillum rugosum]|uniref:Uncharacterized protein n=1 Tax=Azospirillum rugosum TaxID=416170 RepID=A0ABS4SWH5_9PROT|nr:hypothetical protein [Azospirillum rugosum]MBP2296423.1 hypothetical protein [Azospirillum rugosum]MDQ0529944.1 hypothetical protein [Azospirillum rugosum]
MPQAVVLGEALGAFLMEGVSVLVSSSDAGNRPALGRALGCRLSADRRMVTVYVAAVPCADLLAAIGQTGRIAVAVSKPSTHRSVQIKGQDARLVPCEADTADVIARKIDAFTEDVVGIGFTEALVRTLMDHDPADVVAVAFTPSGVFDQTPGPNAGNAIAP